MSSTKTVHLSLGSNIGDKLNNLQDAVFALQTAAGEVVRISSIYQSSAWGFEADDFYNVCIAMQTGLSPQRLLETILDIEKKIGPYPLPGRRLRTAQDRYRYSLL